MLRLLDLINAALPAFHVEMNLEHEDECPAIAPKAARICPAWNS
jgi:hypothetical protein